MPSPSLVWWSTSATRTSSQVHQMFPRSLSHLLTHLLLRRGRIPLSRPSQLVHRLDQMIATTRTVMDNGSIRQSMLRQHRLVRPHDVGMEPTASANIGGELALITEGFRNGFNRRQPSYTVRHEHNRTSFLPLIVRLPVYRKPATC